MFSEFVGGLVVGVVGGVVATAILGLFSWAGKKRRRKEQIQFLYRTIIESFERIGTQKPHVDVNGYRPPDAIPQRASLFDSFLMHMDAALDHRIPDLKYSEVADIRTALANAKSKTSSSTPKDDWQDLVTYSCIYHVFQRVKWLKLPAKLPWRNGE